MGTAFRSMLLVLAGGLFLLGAPGSALSSPPANDNFADAQVISELPFSDSGNLDATTTEPGEPGSCNFPPQTVWYTFTPSVTIVVSVGIVAGSSITLAAYQSNGAGIGGLGFMSCVFGGNLAFTAHAGTTYYFQVGNHLFGPAPMTIDMHQVLPPPSDDFANAKAVSGGLPFSDSIDLTAATTEPDEQVSLGGFSIEASAWYAFTAADSQAVTLNAFVSSAAETLAVYTGASLDTLTEVKSAVFPNLTFSTEAGTTYYIQLGRGAVFGGVTQASFQISVTPPPRSLFGYSPGFPSTFDSVQFDSFAVDPAGMPIQTASWDFGDGSTASGFSVTHRYTSDGDYMVTHTVSTVDGRIGSFTDFVIVRTQDVSITHFLAPRQARAGDKRLLLVSVVSQRSPEMVSVQLLKSVTGFPGAFVTVAAKILRVPRAERNRAVPFVFSYTFTSEDAAQGRVTFEATATLVFGRDGQPTDNTVIRPATIVSP